MDEWNLQETIASPVSWYALSSRHSCRRRPPAHVPADIGGPGSDCIPGTPCPAGDRYRAAPSADLPRKACEPAQQCEWGSFQKFDVHSSSSPSVPADHPQRYSNDYTHHKWVSHPPWRMDSLSRKRRVLTKALEPQRVRNAVPTGLPPCSRIAPVQLVGKCCPRATFRRLSLFHQSFGSSGGKWQIHFGHRKWLATHQNGSAQPGQLWRSWCARDEAREAIRNVMDGRGMKGERRLTNAV
jgi:hypothetical protein